MHLKLDIKPEYIQTIQTVFRYMYMMIDFKMCWTFDDYISYKKIGWSGR